MQTLIARPAVQNFQTEAIPQAGSNLANLDSLRTFDVLSVAVDHLNSMLASLRGAPPAPWETVIGHVGVLAFFVHTSLVLMFSLERLSRFPRLVAPRFYLRRFFRIYPLSTLCVLATLFLKVPAVPWEGTAFHMPSLLIRGSNLLLIQNFMGKQSVSAPLWSLPFEVQMYLALPFCFFFAFKRDRLSLIVSLVLLASVALVVKYSTDHANLLAYIPCFLAGVLAYTTRGRIKPRISALAWPVYLFLWGTVTTTLIANWPHLEMEFGWLACLLLGFSIYFFRDSRNKLWNRATAGLARYSYGIYLAHVPLLWIVFHVWKVPNSILSTGIWLIMTTLVAVLSYHLVEGPMIEVGRKLSLRLDSASAKLPAKPAVAFSGYLSILQESAQNESPGVATL